MSSRNFHLAALRDEHFSKLYTWTINDKHMDHYTCRPFCFNMSEDEYACKMRNALGSASGSYYVMVEAGNDTEPIGKIRSFDYNPRNHSAEFGYYLPQHNRNKGLGTIMLQLFLELSFTDSEYDLNKLYATTSSGNIPSIRLLEKCGLKLDGRQREHYWTEGKRYDQLIYSILRPEWETAGPA